MNTKPEGTRDGRASSKLPINEATLSAAPPGIYLRIANGIFWTSENVERFRVRGTLEVREGARLILTGPNGAGKSTFLRVILDLFRPTSFRFVEFYSGDVEVKRNIGPIVFLPQSCERAITCSITLGMHLDWIRNWSSSRRTFRDLKEIADFFEIPASFLNKWQNAKVQALSMGERQLTALLTALSVSPRLLLLDEPLASLDVVTRVRLVQGLRKYSDTIESLTMLVIGHETEPWAELSTGSLTVRDFTLSPNDLEPFG